MYRRFLVPLDGSAFAESAIPPALSLAERSGGEVYLATVVSPLHSFGLDDEGAGVVRRWLREEGDRAKEYLDDLAGRVLETGTSAPVQTRVLSGLPVRTLHDWVLREGVDQVVMTTHGRGGLGRLWLGSVADGLVRHLPSPILLWRPESEPPDLADRPSLRRVLVPLDGSELAEAIVPWAQELARLFDIPLSLVSVVPAPLPIGSPYLPHAAAEDARARSHAAELEGHLAGVADRLRAAGHEVDTTVLRGPSAVEGILSHQGRVGADVVALSTHGRGGVTRMILGSVADKVIRGTDAHVFVHLDSEEQ